MEIERKYLMKLSLLKKMKLFHVNFRREHGIIYGYVYYVFMIMSVFFIIIGSNYFSGGYAFSTPEDALEMFSCGISYAIVVDVVIPMICGLKNWRKYLLPGTYQSTTNRIAKEILQTEEFTCPIPVADKRKGKHPFLESANYFSFYGQLIPKNEIKEFEFDYSLYRDHRSYIFHVMLKNGCSVKEIYTEAARLKKNCEDLSVRKYLINCLTNEGFEKKKDFGEHYIKQNSEE